MPPKIFLTGGTGYITGTVLSHLVKTHPEYQITCLLRKVPDGWSKHYPNVKVVDGDWDSYDLISKTASEHDIVVHGGKAKHQGVVKAHLDGLIKRNKKSFFIRLGGVGIIADWKDGTYYGERNPKVWSDIDDIDEITSFPEWYIHRPVEKIIQAAAAEHGDKLKTAIVCPPGVYGMGLGLVRKIGLYMPDYYEYIVKTGAAFYTKSGSNTRTWVHVEDIAQVFRKLVENAAEGGGRSSWGKEGYFFTPTEEKTQYEIAKKAGEVLHKHGIISTAEPKQVSVEDIAQMHCGNLGWNYPGGYYEGLYTFACGTRCKADRTTKELDFKGTKPGVLDCMEEDLLAIHERETKKNKV